MVGLAPRPAAAEALPRSKLLAGRNSLCHKPPMNTVNPTHPYTLELAPSPKGDGSVGWAIRRNGKLLERSDKVFRSEQEALKSGQEAVERAFKGQSQPSPTRRRG